MNSTTLGSTPLTLGFLTGAMSIRSRRCKIEAQSTGHRFLLETGRWCVGGHDRQHWDIDIPEMEGARTCPGPPFDHVSYFWYGDIVGRLATILLHWWDQAYIPMGCLILDYLQSRH